MKFKKYLSLSVTFVLGLSMAGVALGLNQKNDASEKNNNATQIPKAQQRVELKHINDTMYVTDKSMSATCASGVFEPGSNSVTVRYFVPADTSLRVRRFCDMNNSLRRQTYRHEMEHARKVLLTKAQNKSPIVSARVAAMNEIMAPASEVVQTADDLFYKGIPCPQYVRTQNGCNAVLTANKTSSMGRFIVDYTNPAVADAVLEYGVEKFMFSFNKGVYRTTIRKKLDGVKTAKYKNVHSEADVSLLIGHVPENDWWGPMFTYTTANGRQVDIWNSATPQMRKRVLERVDSAIKALARPGEKLKFPAHNINKQLTIRYR
ncbi:hypothetical protein HDR61_02635 [bacterium]|nr:hypothetical protein [bacterium]